MSLTPKEFKLAAHLLKMASDSYSNHGCNDLDKGIIEAADFTADESAQFVKEYREWNGDDDWPKKFEQMMDYALMDFIASKLEHP